MKCPVKISKIYTKYRVVYELQNVEQGFPWWRSG